MRRDGDGGSRGGGRRFRDRDGRGRHGGLRSARWLVHLGTRGTRLRLLLLRLLRCRALRWRGHRAFGLNGVPAGLTTVGAGVVAVTRMPAPAADLMAPAALVAVTILARRVAGCTVPGRRTVSASGMPGRRTVSVSGMPRRRTVSAPPLRLERPRKEPGEEQHDSGEQEDGRPRARLCAVSRNEGVHEADDGPGG